MFVSHSTINLNFAQNKHLTFGIGGGMLEVGVRV